MNMWNIHREFRNTRNTDDSLGSGTKLLLPSLSLGFRHDERETQFLLCWLFHLTRQRAAQPLDHNWTGLTQVQTSTRFVLLQISTHCFCLKSLRIPAHRFQAWRYSHPQLHFQSVFFYCDICDCHILPPRAWTHAWAPTHALSRRF